MKHFLIIYFAVAVITTFAADNPGDATAIQGNWKAVKAELASKPMADAVVKSISLKLDNGNYQVYVGDKPDKGTYTFDSSTKPKSMTITGTVGPNAGKIFPAIYELDGNTLRICYDLSGKKRPSEFNTKTGTKLYLVTYLRQNE
jgi:uncharacterized protein (TIGR03067 family)